MFDILDNDWLMVRNKIDPLFQKAGQPRLTSPLCYQGCGIYSQKKADKGELSARFQLKMVGFNRAIALTNCQRLVAHANVTFKELYKNRYPEVKQYLPMQVMFRCFALVRTLLIFELTALIVPDEIIVDPL